VRQGVGGAWTLRPAQQGRALTVLLQTSILRVLVACWEQLADLLHCMMYSIAQWGPDFLKKGQLTDI